MRRLALVGLALGVWASGCTDSDAAPVDLEWPPDATVYFDEYRVFNADCATDEDCAMALGYYHAFDRFVQMDIRRRFTTGRLADILPKPFGQGYANDFADLRAVFSTRSGEPAEEFLYEQASDKAKAMLQAYAVGVNKWIEDMRNGENGATFPREFTNDFLEYSPDKVPPWTPQDSVAAVIALADQLTNDVSAQVAAGAARAAINERYGDPAGDARFSDLWSRQPLEESAILPSDWTPPSSDAAVSGKASKAPASSGASVIRSLDQKLQRLGDLRAMILGSGVEQDEIGSNNWVVGPSLTTAGNALMSNDPHLGMTQPATWYLAHLDAKTNGRGTIHVAGVTFAGIPWPLIGQNEDIAWGATTTYMDFSDVYVEELVTNGSGPTGVLFKGEEVPFIRRTFTITFSDGTTEDKELLFVPHHGPVREIDVDENSAVTLRWTGNDIDTDINLFSEIALATNIEEAKVALANGTTVGQNWVVIDSDNNIGWFPYNRLPKRTWATGLSGDAPPWLPLDGRGDYEWDEYFTLEELPQAMNPAAGYIATANNDMTGALFDGDPTTLPNGSFQPPYQVDAAVGFRHAQIVRLIESFGDQHTRQTMDQIVSDTYSLIGERMRPGILAIASDQNTTPGLDGMKVIDALENWNFTCPTGLAGDYTDSDLVTDAEELSESSGCTAFHVLYNQLRARIEQNENAPGGRAPSYATYYSIVDPTQLAAGDVYWDDPNTTTVEETKFTVMTDALRASGQFLVDWLGADETKWAWGRLHGLQLSEDLSSFGISAYDNPPPGEPLFANDGGLFTVDVANPAFVSDPDEFDFTQTAGPSTRFVCEASPNGPSCTIQLPGGQSSDINSPHYEDLLFPYLRNEPTPLVFDIGEAAANAMETVTFQ